MMTDPKRPGLDCDAPEDAYPRDTYFVGQGVPPPPEGWRREVVPRKTVAGADAYYYSPCGKRMRSKPDVQRFLDKVRPEGKYLDVSIDSFDFSTQAKAIKPPAGKTVKEGKKTEDAGEGGGRGRGRGRGRGAVGGRGRGGGSGGRGKKGDDKAQAVEEKEAAEVEVEPEEQNVTWESLGIETIDKNKGKKPKCEGSGGEDVDMAEAA